MSMETNAHDAAPSVYINLLAAHMTLVRMRDHLRMVSSVVDAMVDAEAEITIRPEGLAWCVSHLADDLEEVAEAVGWSKQELAEH
jgi:hypothetical protein